jgi:hypothetical protein
MEHRARARFVAAHPGPEARVATILTFSPQGAGSRPAPHTATRAEIIVFPRTDVRALRCLTEAGDISSDHPTAASDKNDGG